MKLELKNISLSSIVFSVYPLIAFALSLVNNVFAVSILGEYTITERILQGLIWTVGDTAVLLVGTVVVAFLYNLFCSFGIRGVRFSIEEVEEKEDLQ